MDEITTAQRVKAIQTEILRGDIGELMVRYTKASSGVKGAQRRVRDTEQILAKNKADLEDYRIQLEENRRKLEELRETILAIAHSLEMVWDGQASYVEQTKIRLQQIYDGR